MDVSLVIRHRLNELGLQQRDLATAAQVTESYVSQLLTGKKAPPMAHRTDVYQKMEAFLKLPSGELSKLADLQRIEELKRKLGDPPAPLFKEVRELILSRCALNKEQQIRAIFEKQPFGELERLVTQKLLDVVKRVAEKELESEDWLREVARLSNRGYEQMRVIILEFLDTDIFHLSIENCVAFLEPLIESWDIDLETFGMEIVLNHRVVSEHVKKLEFVEKEPEQLIESPISILKNMKKSIRNGMKRSTVISERSSPPPSANTSTAGSWRMVLPGFAARTAAMISLWRLEPYNKFSAFLAKKICYLRLLSSFAGFPARPAFSAPPAPKSGR